MKYLYPSSYQKRGEDKLYILVEMGILYLGSRIINGFIPFEKHNFVISNNMKIYLKFTLDLVIFIVIDKYI